MPLITRTKAEISDRLKQRFKEAGYNAVNEVGSPENTLIAALSDELSGIYRSVEFSHEATDITQASGSDLDEWASIFGLTRGDSQPARDTSLSNVKFFIDPTISKTASTLAGEYNLGEITIPKGTVLSAGVSIQYRTTAVAKISGNETETFVPVAASGIGSAYNVLAGELVSHNLASYPALANLASFIKCTNLLPITSGQNEETDEELRLRIRNAHSTAVTANNLAVLTAARGVPGVADAAIIPYVYGSGTLAVFIESTTPIVSPGLINAVQDAVDIIKAEGTRAYVQYPDYKALKMKIESTLKSGTDQDSYGNVVKPAIVDYINNLPRGTTFSPTSLYPLLSAGGLAIYAAIQRIQVGDYNIYTRKLLNLQTFLASNQTLSQTEKWYINSNLIDLCFVSG